MAPRCFLLVPRLVEGARPELVEGPSTISYPMVPGRAFAPPGAFCFGALALASALEERKGARNC